MANLTRSMVADVVRQVLLEQTASKSTPAPGKGKPSPLVVNASARHMHLKQSDLEILFGPGAKLTPFKDLYQDGFYAAKETVTLIGPKSRLISNMRILGPLRNYTQIELAYTDAITLGIENVPVRISGDIKGTPGAYVMGPAGLLELKEGVVRAAIHGHMSPSDAEYYGVKHKDIMKLRVSTGDTEVVFDKVHVRVEPKSKLEVHLDTDEANACGLHRAKNVELFK